MVKFAKLMRMFWNFFLQRHRRRSSCLQWRRASGCSNNTQTALSPASAMYKMHLQQVSSICLTIFTMSFICLLFCICKINFQQSNMLRVCYDDDFRDTSLAFICCTWPWPFHQVMEPPIDIFPNKRWPDSFGECGGWQNDLNGPRCFIN